ncbi:MAG: Imm32 family immunity protein [bacterium]
MSANREGLLSLANQLSALAEEAPGSHIHFDQYNSLEDGSVELIIEKTD